ncbi:MAG: hypothetical protein JRI41_07785 [Deltaproteobacteria bacterium]|nr:hypothetical protein [Deltaproteobacteria bacterium]
MWLQLPENREGTWNLLDRSLIGHIPQNSWASIGIDEINPQEILNRFHEVGFDQLDNTVFSRVERETVLTAAEGDESLWKRIPFHETVTGKVTSLPDKNVFLESDLLLPEEFQDTITIIRISEDERFRDAQGKYIPILDNEGLIRILLESREPHKYWQEILDALHRRGRELLADQNLRELLREKCWLTDTRGRAVRPSDVIHLPPIEDEVCRLSEQIEGTYTAPELINSGIRAHPYWSEVRSRYCATGDDALEKVGLLLGESPAHAIGKIRFEDERKFKSVIDIFRNMQTETVLPGWDVLAVVESAYGIEKCIRHILPGIQQSLSVEAVVAVLQRLKCRSENCSVRARKAVIAAYECYLDVFVRTPRCLEALPSINLLNKDGRWRYASELCAGAEGVAREDLIHDRQEAILRPIITSADHFKTEKGSSQEGVFEEDVYAAVKETPERLKEYFAAWEDRIPPNLIRAFLALLGDDRGLRRLAETYEGSHSIEWIRTKFQWVPNMQLDRDGRRGWLYGLNQDETMKMHRFIVEPVLGQTVQVRSICDQVITARLSEDFDSLIVGELWYEWPRDNLIFPKIRLRQIDVQEFSAEQLSTLLRKTAEYLLRHAFCQTNYDLGDLWQEIGEGEQLDIRIAQLLVMKHIPYYLRQLGTHHNERLMGALNLWNDARYRVAEFSQNPEQRLEFEKKELKALEKIQDFLINDREVQETVLEAVRSKIRDFQYSPTSILFELFQNADDAAVELAEIISYPDEPPIFGDDAVPPLPARRFVLRKTEDHLRVMHWGRPVNHAGGSGFPGRERGFHQDLEKMLIFSSSDKPVSRGGVTGKFGLGFKSVFLITNVPKLISGRLQAEILAGMYPKQLENPTPLIAVLKEEAPEARTAGTLIDLHLDLGVSKEVCAKFEKWAAVLAVFAKRIRRLEIDHNGRQDNYEWDPSIVLTAEGVQIEYGALRLAQTQSDAKVPVLHFRLGKSGGLLVGIGPSGFRELPGDVPAIWVVAPTQEDTGIGFAINGAFEVDAGRTRLSTNVDSTEMESLRIGSLLARGLLALFDMAYEDWDKFRERLRLGNELRPYDFWASVWQVLSGAFNHRLDEKVERIIKCVMTDERGLGYLALKRKSLPTGLWGETYQTLTCIGDVKYVLRGAISQEYVFKHLASLYIFRQKVKPSEVISSQIFEALSEISPAFRENRVQWQSLRISSVLDWVAQNDYSIEPSAARVLGQVISSHFMRELGAKSSGQNEAREISEVLRKLRFQTKSGNWSEPRCLLVSRASDSIGDDEPLRAAFAPQHLILSDNYDEAGVAFFSVCRSKMEAPVEEMFSWVQAACDNQGRQAVLRYLLDGELGDLLARRIREEANLVPWLKGLDRQNEIFHGWDEYEIDEILYRKLPSIEQLRKIGDGLWKGGRRRAKLDPADVLTRIQKWWLKERATLIGQYEKDTYPDARFPDLRESEDGHIDRASWLVLFVLGAFHTLGRSRREQHKGFIRLCQEKGWWDVFAKNTPEARADDWMRVLDEYIDTQIDESEYEIWMNRFPTIYRVARHLDDYREAFLSIDRHDTLSDLGGITVTRVNPLFQGGGISAPPIRRSFGIGACFVVRELKRAGLLKSKIAIPHCYVPVARVRRLMYEMDCDDIDETKGFPEQSKIIHRFLCKHLGENESEFHGSYDIPLQILVERRDLQIELLGSLIIDE